MGRPDIKVSRKSLKRAARVLFYVLLAVAPLQTRLIAETGSIRGVAVESGTISLFATQIVAVAFVLVAGTYASLKASRRRSRDRLSALALFLVAVSVASALFSGQRYSIQAASWLALGVAVFASVRAVRPKASVSAVFLLAGAVVQSALALAQFAFQHVTASKWLGVAEHVAAYSGTFVVETGGGRWLRAYGTLPHPNELGAYLAVAAVVAAAAVSRSRWAKERYAALGSFCALGLSLTFSRSAALGFLAGAAALLLSLRRSARRFAPVVVAAVLALAAFSFVLREPNVARVSVQGRLEKISVDERGRQLGDAFTLIAERPSLGHGPGMMPFAVSELDPGRSGWDCQSVHNVPLLVAAEAGLPAAAAWMALLIWVLLSGFGIVGQRAPRRRLFFVAALLALAVAAMFDHFLWSSWFGQLMFWSVMGLASSGKSWTGRIAPAFPRR